MTRLPSHEVVGRRVVPGSGGEGDFTYSVIEASPGGVRKGERRGDDRRLTHLRDGMVAGHHGRAMLECRIRDRSRSGARLRLDKERPLPKLFLLTDPVSRALFRATLIWQIGRDAGVRLSPIEARRT